MAYYKWNHEKNERLKAERGIGFEQVILRIERGDVIDVIGHPNQLKYPNQQMLVVKIKDYAYPVPFVEDGMPYQTLISSILHRFVTGRFIEKPRSNKSLENDV